MADDAIDHELEQMADNPRVAAAIKDHLERLSRGANGPELSEMARDLLSGRTSIREVGQSEAYAKRIMDATDRFYKWLGDLSPEEREELDRKARGEFGDPEE